MYKNYTIKKDQILSCVVVFCNSEENNNSSATQTATPLGNVTGEKLSVAILNVKTV